MIDEKVNWQSKNELVFGTTVSTKSLDPANGYSGWFTVRYGVSETLFKLNDNMEVIPWLAKEYNQIDNNTWEIKIKENIKFQNDKTLTPQAVKLSIERTLKLNARALDTLKIKKITTTKDSIIITTSEENPTLINDLCDPFVSIIDVYEKDNDNCPVGTGPFKVDKFRASGTSYFVKNENYWNGDVNVDEITVRTISDGDTLAMALQSGEIDAAYGMAYASYPLFENDNYKFTSIQTSRCFWGMMNLHKENSGYTIMSDPAVRKAIAMGINKQDFVDVLLNGYGYTATGAFPDSFAFGQGIQTVSFDPDQARAELEAAGWVDTDGDGIREKNGVKLTIRWLTYPSRQELPLLAESAQSTLKDIGIDVQINCTKDHNSIRKDPTAWDIWVSANVNAGLGDPQNFFDTYCLDKSVKNSGGHHSDKLEKLAVQLRTTFDPAERAKIAVEMQQQLLDDNSYVFCSFLRMSMIMKANVSGLEAHTCDFYELTADLDIQ